ncbi:MAG: aminotransferase class III-fold pyridoxal phosphate-dependent enzyme [Chloroflexota bacterium]
MAVDVSVRSARHDSLLRRADNALPGGVPGFTRLPDDVRFVAREGRGSKVYDVDGREYIDYLLGSGPLVLGHAHPAVVEAVKRQVERGATFFSLTEPTIELAELVCQSAPCAELVRFVGSGSEAITFALRVARAFTGRDKVMKFEGGYHGVGDYAQYSLSPHGAATAPEAAAETPGIPRALDSQMVIAPFNDVETAQRLIAEHAAELSSVLVEPLQRCIKPAPGFLERVAETARQHDVLVVFDEVVTGYRLAWGGAQEYYGAPCDLAVYGKALSGGYNTSAIAGRRDVMSLCDPRGVAEGRFAIVSGTHAGNPIGTAAGVATLNELRRPGVFERLHATGNRLRAEIMEAGRRLGVPLQTPGEGPAFMPIIGEHDPADLRELWRNDLKATYQFGIEMVREGALMTPGLKMYLSTQHDDDDIDRTIVIAERALRTIKETLAGKGRDA